MALGLLTHAVLAREDRPAAAAKATPLMAKALPEFPGKEAVMLTVEYPPGAASDPHRHRWHVFVYVLEGSYATQVAGGERVVLKAGETFYELPTDEHVVSANAGDDGACEDPRVHAEGQGARLTLYRTVSTLRKQRIAKTRNTSQSANHTDPTARSPIEKRIRLGARNSKM